MDKYSGIFTGDINSTQQIVAAINAEIGANLTQNSIFHKRFMFKTVDEEINSTVARTVGTQMMVFEELYTNSKFSDDKFESEDYYKNSAVKNTELGENVMHLNECLMYDNVKGDSILSRAYTDNYSYILAKRFDQILKKAYIDLAHIEATYTPEVFATACHYFYGKLSTDGKTKFPLEPSDLSIWEFSNLVTSHANMLGVTGTSASAFPLTIMPQKFLSAIAGNTQGYNPVILDKARMQYSDIDRMTYTADTGYPISLGHKEIHSLSQYIVMTGCIIPSYAKDKTTKQSGKGFADLTLTKMEFKNGQYWPTLTVAGGTNANFLVSGWNFNVTKTDGSVVGSLLSHTGYTDSITSYSTEGAVPLQFTVSNDRSVKRAIKNVLGKQVYTQIYNCTGTTVTFPITLIINPKRYYIDANGDRVLANSIMPNIAMINASDPTLDGILCDSMEEAYAPATDPRIVAKVIAMFLGAGRTSLGVVPSAAIEGQYETCFTYNPEERIENSRVLQPHELAYNVVGGSSLPISSGIKPFNYTNAYGFNYALQIWAAGSKSSIDVLNYLARTSFFNTLKFNCAGTLINYKNPTYTLARDTRRTDIGSFEETSIEEKQAMTKQRANKPIAVHMSSEAI